MAGKSSSQIGAKLTSLRLDIAAEFTEIEMTCTPGATEKCAWDALCVNYNRPYFSHVLAIAVATQLYGRSTIDG